MSFRRSPQTLHERARSERSPRIVRRGRASEALLPAAQAAWRHRRASVAAALLTVLAGCADDAATAASPSALGDIILVTVDTLRADHVGICGYDRPTTPNLDAFFESGVVYRRSYSTEASTSPSVVSILTGRLPQDHGVRLLYQIMPKDVSLVTELLPPAYQTAAFVSNVVLTNEALGIADRFDHYNDFVDEQEPMRKVFERNAERTTDAALTWVSAHADADRPLFLWVHYIDPHGPYRPPADWDVDFTHAEPEPIDIEQVPFYIREEGLTDGLGYVDRYDEEIAYMDAHVGRLLEALDDLRAMDHALVVFTADHGESMMDHAQWFTHAYHVYEELVRVPLMLRGPGVRTGRVDVLASGTDVTPTLLRFAGVELPDGVPDVDLRDPATLDRDRVVFMEASQPKRQWRAAVHGDDKWVVKVTGVDGRVRKRIRYDLAGDPGESTELDDWDESAPGAEALLRVVDADPDPAGIPADYREGIRPSSPKVAPHVDEDALEALRALGYVR